MSKPRNYQAEYARRIASGLAQGLSRSQARGHPKPKEAATSAKHIKQKPVYDPRLEEGLKQMRDGANLTHSAKSIGVSRERLRAYLHQTGIVRRKRHQWLFRKDKRKREMLVYSQGQAIHIIVSDYKTAVTIGRYFSEVGQFLNSNDPSHLQPFIGETVRDVNGKCYVLEIRPNVLYRLADGGSQTFEQVYRIVV